MPAASPQPPAPQTPAASWASRPRRHVAAFMQTLVVPSSGLRRDCSTPARPTLWVITPSSPLPAAVATPVAGRLGDMYGKRRLLIAFHGPARRRLGRLRPVELGRADDPRSRPRPRHGRGPAGISLPATCCRPSGLGSSIALMSASMASAALGLPFSAAVAEHASWRVPSGSPPPQPACRRPRLAGRPRRPDRPRCRLAAWCPRPRRRTVALLPAVTKGSVWAGLAPPPRLQFSTAAVVLLAWGRWAAHPRPARRPPRHRPPRRSSRPTPPDPGRLRDVRPVARRPGSSCSVRGDWLRPRLVSMMAMGFGWPRRPDDDDPSRPRRCVSPPPAASR